MHMRAKLCLFNGRVVSQFKAPSCATTKLILFAVSKVERNKSMKNAFMYCGIPKGTSQVEATLNSEKNQVCILNHCYVTKKIFPRGAHTPCHHPQH